MLNKMIKQNRLEKKHLLAFQGVWTRLLDSVAGLLLVDQVEPWGQIIKESRLKIKVRKIYVC